MKSAPIVAAEVDFSSDPAVPRAPAFGDCYHPASGAFAQADAVFLAGNALPGRWQRRQRFAILETGFGLGNNFLATWAAWRDDPKRCERLDFISIEKHPLTASDMARAHAATPHAALAQQLTQAWPAHTHNLHCREFEGGRVRLLLALGDIQTWSRELVARIDAFYLDGFAPARNPAMWDASVFAMLARLAAPGATAATWSAARAVREGLQGAGFEVSAAPGSGGKRDITLARFAPRFRPPVPPGRQIPDSTPSHALVVGGGLAGALTARALARQGIECTVVDRHAAPASETSGNPAGIFHGVVMGHDGTHARFLRAAALSAEVALRAVLAQGVRGAVDGLLRLESRRSLADMRALLADQALPARYVQALDAVAASQLAGVALDRPAWHYPGGGWVDPAGWVGQALATPGVRWLGATPVHGISRQGEIWQLLGEDHAVLADAPLLVLACATDSLRLAGLPSDWLQSQRGQLSWSAAPAPIAPSLPLASGATLLGLPDGRLLMGATSQAGDAETALRERDHQDNLARAAALLAPGALDGIGALGGRVGWRVSARDRLPLVGRAPDTRAVRPARADAPRLLARQAGLWLHTGLGSRGLTTATLCGELIAAQACGAPWPLEADLADAIDPARCLLRG